MPLRHLTLELIMSDITDVQNSPNINFTGRYVFDYLFSVKSYENETKMKSLGQFWKFYIHRNPWWFGEHISWCVHDWSAPQFLVVRVCDVIVYDDVTYPRQLQLLLALRVLDYTASNQDQNPIKSQNFKIVLKISSWSHF